MSQLKIHLLNFKSFSKQIIVAIFLFGKAVRRYIGLVGLENFEINK